MMPTRQVMINTVAILAVLFGAWFLIQIRSTILLLVIGILFGAAIEPLVNRLRKRGLSRGQSIVVVYVSLLALLVAVLVLVLPPLVSQANELYNDVPSIIAELRESAVASSNGFVNTNGVQILDRALRGYNQVKANPPIQEDQAVAFATSVGGFLFTSITVLIVAFYWMTEKAIIKRLILGLIPIEKREVGHGLWDEIESRIGGWTRGQLTLCFAIGSISTVGYFLLGLDFWLALGIWAGITEIIPFIGPILGGLASVTIALTDSWQKAVVVALFVLALQQLESAFLVPRVMRNAVGMSPLTVILAVLIGGSLGGPLGAIIAIPVGAACQVILQELLRTRADSPDNRPKTPIPSPAALTDEPVLPVVELVSRKGVHR